MSDGFLFFIAVISAIGSWEGFRRKLNDERGWRWYRWIDYVGGMMFAGLWLWFLYHRLGLSRP